MFTLSWQKQFISFLLGICLVGFFLTIVDKKFVVWSQIVHCPAEILRDDSSITVKSSAKELNTEKSPGKEPSTNSTADSTKFSYAYFKLTDKYIHLPRLIVTYPIIKLHNLTQIHYNLVFTYFCCLFISIFALMSARIVCLLEKKDDNFLYYFFGTLVFFTLLSLNMNGRLIYSFIGGAFLLYGQTHCLIKNETKLLYLFSFIAIILSNVSSGTFMVILSSSLLFIIISQRLPKHFYLYIILLAPLACSYLLKNYSYYNSLWGLLTHGYGKVITDVYNYNSVLGIAFLGTFIVAAAILFYSMLINMKKFPHLTPFLSYTYSTIILGTFGWSTLSMIFPVFLILTPYLILNTRKNFLPA